MDHSPSDTPNGSFNHNGLTGVGRWTAGQQLFGRYEVIREIGRGGMGVVLLAHDTELRIESALKLIPDLLIHDDEALDDLKQEVLKGMTLTHPGIVRTHGLVRDETMAAIVMEYVDGGTFHDLKRLQPGGCFDPAELHLWLEQLCPALDYAHFEIQIAHRDIKPRNLMYTLSGRIKIADFGISTTLGDQMTRATMKGPSSGTPAYMSPQQVMGGRPSHLDDIYSLGATLYELLTGKPPFHQGEIVYQVLECAPPSMNARREELGLTGLEPVPEAWERVIAACLSKQPSKRPQSAGELIQWLNQPPTIQLSAPSPAELTTDAPVEHAPQPGTTGTHRAGRKRRLLVAAAALAVVTGSAVFYRSVLSEPEAPPPLVAPLTVTSNETLPAGTVGLEYSHKLAATGGTPPYAWSVGTEKAPAGLAVDPDGRIHGTPTAAAPGSTIDVTLSDAAKLTARRTFHLTIHPAAPKAEPAPVIPQPRIPPPRITAPKVLPQGMAGTPYEFKLSGDGGSPPFVWSLAAGGLPPGLALSAEGVIAGMPQDAATETFELRAADQNGKEAVMNASLAILPRPDIPAAPVAPSFKPEKEKPYINSLGMRFVPAGTTDVYFSVWLTRVSDFREFVQDTGYDAKARAFSLERGGKPKPALLGNDWDQPGFVQTVNRPVCAVSWDDARKFCTWLTEKEHTAGTLPVEFVYRLPTDAEWRRALGFDDGPDAIAPDYPWGNGRPPNLGGNLAGEEIRNGEIPKDCKIIPRFRDNVPYTSLVDHFPANILGIHDMYGNLWQFCEDADPRAANKRLLRGGSWLTFDPQEIALATSFTRVQSARVVDAGFRCVIARNTPAPP